MAADGTEHETGGFAERNLVSALNRWAAERLLKFPLRLSNLLELNARLQITSAIKKDLESVKSEGLVSPLGLVSEEIAELKKLGVSDTNMLARQSRDGSFVTRFRRDGDEWIAEELGKDNKIISQAKVGPDETRLSFNFLGGTYKRIGGEVRVDNSEKFQNGSVTVFKLLVGTLKRPS